MPSHVPRSLQPYSQQLSLERRESQLRRAIAQMQPTQKLHAAAENVRSAQLLVGKAELELIRYSAGAHSERLRGLSGWAVEDADVTNRMREGFESQRDERRPESHAEAGKIEPSITAACIEDPTTQQRTGRQADELRRNGISPAVSAVAIDGLGSMTSGIALDPTGEILLKPEKRSKQWAATDGKTELGVEDLEARHIMGDCYSWFHY